MIEMGAYDCIDMCEEIIKCRARTKALKAALDDFGICMTMGE